MSIEEIIKLNKKLGEYYVLVPTLNDNWRLFRTVSNREVMNSDKNTKEELLKFIKEHKKYNMTSVISTTCLVINIVWLLVIIANFFIKSTVLMCMSWGVLTTLLPILIVLDVVMSNNRKVMNKVADEDIEYVNKLEAEYQKISKTKSKTYTVKGKNMTLGKGEVKNTSVTKAKVKNSTPTTRRKPRTKGEDKKDV